MLKHRWFIRLSTSNNKQLPSIITIYYHLINVPEKVNMRNFQQQNLRNNKYHNLRWTGYHKTHITRIKMKLTSIYKKKVVLRNGQLEAIYIYKTFNKQHSTIYSDKQKQSDICICCALDKYNSFEISKNQVCQKEKFAKIYGCQ